VYAGSLERLDFGDEADDKGFYLVEIVPDKKTGQRQVSFEFHPLGGRRFITIKVDIEPQDPEPTLTIVKAIARQQVSDAIVRLQISLPQEIEGQIRGSDIGNALEEAHYYTIIKDVRRQSRLRLGDRTAEEITPVEALRAYLESIELSPERAKLLRDYGEKLIQEQISG
jgi:exonuclease SbcD